MTTVCVGCCAGLCVNPYHMAFNQCTIDGQPVDVSDPHRIKFPKEGLLKVWGRRMCECVGQGGRQGLSSGAAVGCQGDRGGGAWIASTVSNATACTSKNVGAPLHLAP
eukprot:358978-Chlamydomonas_euryale.AAC.1